MSDLAEHPIGPAEQIPVGEGRAYAVAGTQIAVFRLRTGQVCAVQATCPHAAGPLADGLIDGQVIICPLHGHTFELATGRSTTGQPPVRTYPAHVDPTGHIVVRVEQPGQQHR
jgi:nitrite reductase/ring-hydroxylating ferredoxin subunit